MIKISISMMFVLKILFNFALQFKSMFEFNTN